MEVISDREALRIHGIKSSDDDCSSDNDADFDVYKQKEYEEFLKKYQPPPVRIPQERIIEIQAEDTGSVEEESRYTRRRKPSGKNSSRKAEPPASVPTCNYFNLLDCDVDESGICAEASDENEELPASENKPAKKKKKKRKKKNKVEKHNEQAEAVGNRPSKKQHKRKQRSKAEKEQQDTSDADKKLHAEIYSKILQNFNSPVLKCLKVINGWARMYKPRDADENYEELLLLIDSLIYFVDLFSIQYTGVKVKEQIDAAVQTSDQETEHEEKTEKRKLESEVSTETDTSGAQAKYLLGN
ncbi:hypothetical protein NQ315_001034 [Exocentrus adspersus]|uniref:Uncharacterized protein n=1 Tax=Exocentrus adspersus TaxID=1586481 RepID=A0AAV8WE29_9CUCU|nr:hypothetical protein NQ315_001034 [Exocentrus adspersus]